MLNDQRGIAVILVLVVMILLVSLVVDFSYTMRIDLTLAANLRDETKAFYVARSGVEVARLMVAVREDEPPYDALDADWARFNEHPGFISEEDEGRFRGTIEDEASKIGINDIVNDQGVVDQKRLEWLTKLFELLELDSDLIDPIIDWLDPDDRARPFGAEDPEYLDLSPSYPCKDGPLATIEELLLVKGMTEEILYGNKEKKGLANYLTVHSDGKVNINTASSLVLQSLSDKIEEGLAEAIIEYRQDDPFTAISDVQNVPGVSQDIYSEISPYITIQSSLFSVQIEGRVREIRKRIFAVLKRGDGGVKLIHWRVE